MFIQTFDQYYVNLGAKCHLIRVSLHLSMYENNISFYDNIHMRRKLKSNFHYTMLLISLTKSSWCSGIVPRTCLVLVPATVVGISVSMDDGNFSLDVGRLSLDEGRLSLDDGLERSVPTNSSSSHTIE